MKKRQFGDYIVFNETFYDVAYIAERELANTKLYVGETEYSIVEHKETLTRTIFPAAYRKILFQRAHGSGIIIGQTKKFEGIYHPSYANHREHDYEQAYLETKSCYTFWVVAVGLNKTVLVPK